MLVGKPGGLDEALHEFAETLRFESGYSGMRDCLAELQTMKARPLLFCICQGRSEFLDCTLLCGRCSKNS